MSTDATTTTAIAPASAGLWAEGARDWAEVQEQGALPLHAAALDAAGVTRGTRLLDAGCGTGLVSLLARLRGAHVTAIDASPGMLTVARERLPGADLRAADLQSLPFADGTFDVVLAVNSLFFAPDMGKAAREVARVARPGGRVVATCWGPPDRCESLATMRAIAPLMPPPPPGAPAVGPIALNTPGALETLLTNAGLRVLESGEVACTFIQPNADTAWRGFTSTGMLAPAIRAHGEGPVRAALAEAQRPFTRPDGTIRQPNVFRWVATTRP